ncbi:uncharacterized protein LOC129311239 [Prosopis cineraria]|uniref:uncharacterized protein LOC129311239 n=1 Tax=Prosopis cineraria TaxID=364024 RepID=UPI0024109202|nr:uncharacterized protein LOC129311239 [Prosopis cineraria]
MIEGGLIIGADKLSSAAIASGLTSGHHHPRRVGGAQARSRIASTARLCRLDYGKHDLTGSKSSHSESIARFLLASLIIELNRTLSFHRVGHAVLLGLKMPMKEEVLQEASY